MRSRVQLACAPGGTIRGEPTRDAHASSTTDVDQGSLRS